MKQINTFELMRGNLLTYAGTPVHVFGFYANKIELGYFTDSIGFERNNFDPNISYVPITPEILINSGFTKDGSGYLDKYTLGRFVVYDTMNGYITDLKTAEPMTYVHELQNRHMSEMKAPLTIQL